MSLSRTESYRRTHLLRPHPRENLHPRSPIYLTLLLLVTALSAKCLGGGSGFNTFVIVNQNSPGSVEVGNYYCERRQVPPENLLRINWTGGNTAWTNSDFETLLLNPLLNAITNRHLERQISYVVLSMDIPFQTVFNGMINSTTAALFYGLKDEGSSDWVSITNSYSRSEMPFEASPPRSAPGYSFLTTMITANSVAEAKALIDHGIAADSTMPRQPVLLEKSSDPVRNIRYWAFDNAVFNTRIARSSMLVRTNCDSPWGQTNLLGLQTGLTQFQISQNSFVPGAMADSLTSYGGVIFGPNDQTTLLAFISAGASGSYGTVTEPAPTLQKFPVAQAFFYQARGFTLAECYYQSINEPYQGLIVAEPLAAPFSRAAQGRWNSILPNLPLSGQVPLSVQWMATDADHPLGAADLFVDGKFFRALTNAGASAGDVLSVSLNGYPVSYTPPPGADIATIAAGVASAINSTDIPGAPNVTAVTYGDRIELRASTNYSGPVFYVDRGLSSGQVHFYRTVLLPLPAKAMLTAPALDPAGSFNFHIEPPDERSFRIEASTNLIDWIAIATDLSGSLDFSDPAAAGLPARFYRVMPGPAVDIHPRVTQLGFDSFGAFKLHIENPGNGNCTIEASPDLIHWIGIENNALANFDLIDSDAPAFAARFYRAATLLPPPHAPRVGMSGQTQAGEPIIQIEHATRPYTLQVSTDLIHWSTVYTNAAPAALQLSARTSSAAAAGPTVNVRAARPLFLNSPAQGVRRMRLYGALNPGSVVQLGFTKTNGSTVSIVATNQSSTGTVFDFAQSLVSAIASCPDLQGPDGVEVSDLSQSWFGSALFNLRARSPGLDAAAITVCASGPAGLLSDPGNGFALDQNLSDLQPRNHLYITAGVTNFALRFSVDTTQLSDGWHELTAVAYEGSNVRTQSRVSLPIRVGNSKLNASLAFSGLIGTNASTGAAYSVQVAVNRTNVTSIRLFTTGGLLDMRTNQYSASFMVNGSVLGPGLHPFYATIDTADGLSYRMQTRFVRFVNP